MDDVESFGSFQERGQVHAGVEVEAAAWHQVRVQVQNKAMEGVMQLSGPMFYTVL
jgi:hypothetical protein